MRTRRHTFTIAVAAAALALAAFAEAASADSQFRTPSGQIVCLYSKTGGPGPFLRCDLRFLNDRAVFLRRHGQARMSHVTDAVPPTGRVLRYGHSRKLGPFRCRSRRSGLSCRSRSGHGFAVSRERQRVY